MKSSRTRLKDVAAKLNLSPALVSGVLNNRPHIWASEETCARILEVAQELNYYPSAAAQALSRGKTDLIVFVYKRLPEAAYRLAYSGLMDALSSELQGAGYDLTVANFATQEEVMAHLQKLASSRGCDAIVLWGREEDTEPQAKLLEALNIPFVVKGRHEVVHPHWYQVDFDHESMMAQCYQRLVALGHQRIAYLGFESDDGFVQCLKSGFLNSRSRHPVEAEESPLFFAEFGDEFEPNICKIREWLHLSPKSRPTGFVIGAGNKAWQALEVGLAEVGRKLTNKPGGFSASGITSSPFNLMFGEADVYQEIEIDKLARFVIPALVRSLNHESGDERIVRFLPKLSQARTLAINVKKSLQEGEATI